ncbi:MAG TPA: divergent polysaccharide deacetylase family protein [Atribacteraceae bacterium]|nr:divergent polysaccharide deacetylase family protein [Atribacteraceae bacterium]
MKWPWSGKAVFWFIVVSLIAVSLTLINEVTRENPVRNRYIAFARMAPSEQEKWLALFILQEIQELLPSLVMQTVDLPGTVYEALEVQVEIRKNEERDILAQRMQLIFSILSQFGYYGERRAESDGDRYYIFRDLKPWFVLDVLLITRYQVALVIDDFGYSLEKAERFAALPHKLTMAILPHLPLSPVIARRAREVGREVIIHFPMEAVDPAQNEREPFLLRTGTDIATIRRMLIESREGVPYAVGLNNHKGSRATSDRTTMEKFMRVLREKNLYFLDSLTSVSSLAYSQANVAGITSYRRDVFLDGEDSREYVLDRLHETVALARRQGYAVAIGHPRDETYQALTEFFNSFNDPDIEFLYLSEIRR